ncbi:Ribosomal RNA small subunit methyltransferase A [Gracilariopsis chorda]|uniref:rRNA adenine N(6)-methyltransferase n=1 Tax=Gracilariopsis chorda TaxID=448386 RepID=A0A2V3ILX0_9FLOR|nr:Ribosomal RNA small subunit methyltransferase A [Gracilariopsis chorda]|eukprot:PXF43053.1 Ribosomal RNA small subunit methyltransferase A [Gracilariopsis chorda]
MMKRARTAASPVSTIYTAFSLPSPLPSLRHSESPFRSLDNRTRCTLSASSYPSQSSPRSIHPKKSLSQNFLRDKNFVNRIVSAFRESTDNVEPVPTVVEVGPGLGALTDNLLQQYPRMHAIEIDQRAVQHLQVRHPHLNLHHADVLQTDWSHFSKQLNAPLAIIGNLPYNIVSQILFSLLEAPDKSVTTALVMMQKEVAQRVIAKPHSKSYGILSVVSQLYAKPKLLFSVPNTAFFPVPQVTSAMVRLDMEPHPNFDKSDLSTNRALRTVVRTAFNQRRKRLRNALKTISQGKQLPNGWDLKRAEELEPVEFLELTRFLFPDGMQESRDREGKALYSVWR